MQQVMTKFHIRGSSGLGSRFNDVFQMRTILYQMKINRTEHICMKGRSLARPITRDADENISDKAYSRDMLRRPPAL